MKEILFRAKRTDRDKWVQGYYVFNTNGFDFDDDEYKEYHRIQPLQPNGMLDIIREVDPATVGQYTGLKDKNGTKIFEGDIVKRLFYLERPVLSVVTFKNGAFGLEWNRGKVKEFLAFTSICNCTYEVIGNIHDNAELLGDI